MERTTRKLYSQINNQKIGLYLNRFRNESKMETSILSSNSSIVTNKPPLNHSDSRKVRKSF
jgi:hypothetical protein